MMWKAHIVDELEAVSRTIDRKCGYLPLASEKP